MSKVANELNYSIAPQYQVVLEHNGLWDKYKDKKGVLRCIALSNNVIKNRRRKKRIKFLKERGYMNFVEQINIQIAKMLGR